MGRPKGSKNKKKKAVKKAPVAKRKKAKRKSAAKTALKRKVTKRKPKAEIPDLTAGKFCLVKGGLYFGVSSQWCTEESQQDAQVFDDKVAAQAALSALVAQSTSIGLDEDGATVAPLSKIAGTDFLINVADGNKIEPALVIPKSDASSLKAAIKEARAKYKAEVDNSVAMAKRLAKTHKADLKQYMKTQKAEAKDFQNDIKFAADKLASFDKAMKRYG